MIHDEAKLLTKFFENVSKDASGCWLWKGSLSTANYAQMWDGEKLIGAHRFSYSVFVGPIPEGLSIMHSCDTPPCVNPMHLSPGTYKMNMEDCARKGRTCPGEKNGNNRYTEDLVIQVRSDPRSSRVVAKHFGVSQCFVVRVKSRKLWKHLK